MYNNNDDDKSRSVEKYLPKKITNSKEMISELQIIDSNPALSFIDKHKFKKQIMRTFFLAKQQEIDGYLDSFENYLLAKKDVEAKAIALEAQKAVMRIEKEQLDVMKNMGLSHAGEIADTLIKSGEMLTEKLKEVRESKMVANIKKSVVSNIRNIWDKTNKRIIESVDTYMEELHSHEKNIRGF